MSGAGRLGADLPGRCPPPGATAPGPPTPVTPDMAMAALAAAATPILMLGPGREIVYANRAGRALLGARRAFKTQSGRLHLQRQSDRDALNVALLAVRQRGERAVVRLTNRQGDVNHVIAVSPMPDTPDLLLTVAELRVPLLLPPAWSSEALALPAHYAELAEALVSGENLSEFADRTGLTIGGARTRLKKLLRRLSVRSQADLVAMLLRTAAALGMP